MNCQRMCIGSAILDKLFTKCKNHNTKDIHLFPAKDKYTFYEQYNFEKQANNTPGM